MSKKKPRILIVTGIYPPYAGGASVYFSALVQSLRNKVEPIVLTTYHKTKPIVDTDRGAKIFRVISNIQQPALLRRISAILTSFMTCLLLWLIYKPRVMHSHYSGGIAFGAGLFSLIFRVPIVKDVRGVDAFSDKFLFQTNIKLGKVKKYISCAEEIRKGLLSLGIPQEKVMVQPIINHPIINQTAGLEQARDDNRIRILFVGELTKGKGIDILLDAFKLAAKEREDIRLICVGDGAEKRKCQRLIEESGLKDQVNLLGKFSHRETLGQIAKSDFLVIPSRTEGTPRTILEAFAFGKPVIASNVGGIPEVVKDGENGVLVEYGDVHSLAKATLSLTLDEELRERLGRNGKNYLKTLPSWYEIATEIVGLYHEIIRGSSK